MKILLVHNFYQSTHVGGEDLVFEQEKSALISALGKQNVFTYTVSNDNLNKLHLFFNIWSNRVHAKKIHDLISSNHIQIMHVHNYFPLLTPSIFKAAKRAGAKIVYTLHNYREWCLSGLFYRESKPDCIDCSGLKLPITGIKNGCYRGSKTQSLLAGLAYFFYKSKKHLNFVDKFFVLSETQQQILKKIQTPIFLKSQIKPSFIEQKKHDVTDRKKYLFVGRLEKIKGIELLLFVWSNLDASFELEIIGSGPDQENLKQLYQKNNITFLGKLPRDQVLKKMAQAKYVIHPGIVQETQGLTILEALAQSTPVIGFAIGTRKEYIQNGHNGFLCEPGNLAETLMKAEDIFKHKPEFYQTLCEQAELSVCDFMPDKITAKQMQCYAELLEWGRRES